MTLDKLYHKSLLMRILKDIFSDQLLVSSLGFKGGTAAMIFYDLPRFSVDLDFDLIAPRDTESLDTLNTRLSQILSSYGTIKKTDKKRYTTLFLLSYAEKRAGHDTIKLEINPRDFGSRYTMMNYLGFPCYVMDREDMAAHKLVAMYERLGKAQRDIFDVWYFLQNSWHINKEIVEQRTSMRYEQFLERCCTALEKFDRRHILSGLGELLSDKQKHWVKEHLLDETIFLLKTLQIK